MSLRVFVLSSGENQLMRTVAVVSSLLAAFALACGGAAPAAHEPGHHEEGEHGEHGEHGVKDEGDVKENGDAKVGDKTRCPVSGEVFRISPEQPHVEYKGKTYYTCCSHCLEKLKADPAKYIKAKD
jgi:YHS domain-containing protein